VSRAEQKAQTRRRITDAAGRGFRKGGFGGVGVDGLAKEAGVTSGAFYVHFASKTEAFREAVATGLEELKSGISQLQLEHDADWWPVFVRFYLGTKRTCDLSQSCVLQSLAPEVARADTIAHRAFEAGLRSVAELIVSGPPSPATPNNVGAALLALATLVGAVTLARAVSSESVANQIAAAAESALLHEITSVVTPRKK
jgi:TetR/AcrR family transcriptional regulator, transcriptional repressor for nem operon